LFRHNFVLKKKIQDNGSYKLPLQLLSNAALFLDIS